MSGERKIAWEKFTPLYEVDKIHQVQQDELEDNHEATELEEDEVEDEHQAVGRLLNLEDILINDRIKTPFGWYQTDDDFSPYNMFECWIGHTNFKLTRKDFNILNNEINGIGCLKIISPYRFFIGIEKMFSFAAVRIQIQKDLCNNLDLEERFIDGNDNIDNVINMAISKINDAFFSIKDSERWAVFVSHDGEVQTIKNSEYESDFQYYEDLAELKSFKNGNIITYDSL